MIIPVVKAVRGEAFELHTYHLARTPLRCVYIANGEFKGHGVPVLQSGLPLPARCCRGFVVLVHMIMFDINRGGFRLPVVVSCRRVALPSMRGELCGIA